MSGPLRYWEELELGRIYPIGVYDFAEAAIIEFCRQFDPQPFHVDREAAKGSLFGASNPMHDIKNILSLYKDGLYKLDELVTKEYTLDQINEGYEDMSAGVNLRGVIRY